MTTIQIAIVTAGAVLIVAIIALAKWRIAVDATKGEDRRQTAVAEERHDRLAANAEADRVKAESAAVERG